MRKVNAHLSLFRCTTAGTIITVNHACMSSAETEFTLDLGPVHMSPTNLYKETGSINLLYGWRPQKLKPSAAILVGPKVSNG